MEISRKTDYGIRVILDLSSLPANERASAEEIAARQAVPVPFLAKIISHLALAGFVVTQRGAHGGVSLARPPAEITLLQVIEALEGPVRLNRCLIQPEACPRNGTCPVHVVLEKAQTQLVAVLGATSFDSLVPGPTLPAGT